MASQWYVLKGEKVSGPFVKDQLKSLAKTGQIGPTTLVRRGEAGPWTSASDLKGLFPWLNQVPDGPPPEASPRQRADTGGPSSQVVLAGGIVGAILVAAVVVFVMKGGSSEEDVADADAAGTAKPVVPVVEFVPVANPVAEPSRPVADVPAPRPAVVSAGPTEFVPSQSPKPDAGAGTGLSSDEAPAATDAPAEPVVDDAPQLNPKPLLPPVPTEKKPITDRELSDSTNGLRWRSMPRTRTPGTSSSLGAMPSTTSSRRASIPS